MNAADKAKNSRLIKTYGITLEEYLSKLEEQEGKCFICRTTHPRMCIDHIHIKGYKSMPGEEKKKYVRGILCFMCNVGLKGFEKTVNGLRNRKQLEGTVKYFEVFKLKGEDI
jgi:hypothetical protein